MRRCLYIALVGLLLTACGTAPQPTLTPTAPTRSPLPATNTAGPAPLRVDTFADWQDRLSKIDTADPGLAQPRADDLWRSLTAAGRVPLILEDQIIFLYKGQAQHVTWRGVFSNWGNGPGLDGRRIGQTDLWVAQTRFPPASRVEYKMVLDDENWILDPANPAAVASGKTTNSLLVMPGFRSTDESQPRPGVPSGTLSGNIPIASRSLGYTVNYRVYTPPGYDKLSKLPALYVLDGSDFIDPRMGAEPTVLDNMLADGRIAPLIAVFGDPYEPGNPDNNRRESEFLSHSVEYARFIATELVPAIDRAYRTDPQADSRIIQGVSYGGLSAIFIAASYPQVFHNLAALSPSLWALQYPSSLDSPFKAAGVRKMVDPIDAILVCGGDSGITCPALPLKIFVSYGNPDWDVGDLSGDVADLQREGYPTRVMRLQEGHAWSAWRGVLDELLSGLIPPQLPS